MRIKSVEARWVHVPIEPSQQHTSDFGRATSFDCALVRIETESGLVGWGEAREVVGSTGNARAASCAATRSSSFPRTKSSV